MADEEDDDYMNMTFDDSSTTASKKETSLQRRQREKREAEIRGRPKSKAELAAQAAAEREAALSRSLIEQDQTAVKKSKGLAMMAKMGFKPGGALGAKKIENEQKGVGKEDGNGSGDGSASKVEGGNAPLGARTEPIMLEMKEDRGGIGLDSERKRKINEAYEGQEKKVKVADVGEYRDRVRRERELGRAERQAYGAMKVCEKLWEEQEEGVKESNAVIIAEEDGGDDDDTKTERDTKKADRGAKRPISIRPLKLIPVEWRGLVRSREEAERDRRMRYDLDQTSRTRLPGYDDDTEDADDRTALGKSAIEAYAPVEDLEEEDLELEEFAELEADERLRRTLAYLRAEFNYCFWCKFQYEDDELDGCPGLTEEEHD